MYACHIQGVKMLDLGNGITVGIVGLQEVLEHFHSQGRRACEDLGEELLAAVKPHNYVTDSAVGLYKAALRREYAYFCVNHSEVRFHMGVWRNRQAGRKSLHQPGHVG